MPKLAVLILTKNEEKNIAECIQSAAFANEIVVIDSGSTDRTRELAESAGARFVVHLMDDEGFAGQRNYALTQTNADWVFYLDADERITAKAAGKIQQLVERDEAAAYRVERKNILFGRMMHYGGHRPDYVARLYPRKAIHWQGKVHEGIETNLPIRKLSDVLHHYTYTTWQQYFAKTNHYTSLSAQAMYARGKKAHGGTVLAHGFFAFVKSYLLKKGFLDGYLGLVMSLMAAYADLMKYLKLQNLYRLSQKD